MGRSGALPIGWRIDVMGFPLTYEQHITTGIITSKPTPNVWHTDASLNPGNSGGPVFNEEDGTAIGLVTGGAVTARLSEGMSIAVDGIKFFAPLDVSNLLARVRAASPTIAATRAGVVESVDSPILLPPLPPPPPPPPVALPQTFARSYTVSVEKNDHPVLLASHSRNYAIDFVAEPGYRITRVTGVDTHSVNHASNITTDVSADGTRVTVRLTLTSGSMIDQYRGWLDAAVLTQQERR